MPAWSVTVANRVSTAERSEISAFESTAAEAAPESIANAPANTRTAMELTQRAYGVAGRRTRSIQLTLPWIDGLMAAPEGIPPPPCPSTRANGAAIPKPLPEMLRKSRSVPSILPDWPWQTGGKYDPGRFNLEVCLVHRTSGNPVTSASHCPRRQFRGRQSLGQTLDAASPDDREALWNLPKTPK